MADKKNGSGWATASRRKDTSQNVLLNRPASIMPKKEKGSFMINQIKSTNSEKKEKLNSEIERGKILIDTLRKTSEETQNQLKIHQKKESDRHQRIFEKSTDLEKDVTILQEMLIQEVNDKNELIKQIEAILNSVEEIVGINQQSVNALLKMNDGLTSYEKSSASLSDRSSGSYSNEEDTEGENRKSVEKDDSGLSEITMESDGDDNNSNDENEDDEEDEDEIDLNTSPEESSNEE